MPQVLCPLCGSTSGELFHRDAQREYVQCGRCALIFVPWNYHLTAGEEKAEYDLHRNSPEDMGYRRFLGRLSKPLLERLPPGSVGLDFGCGPGPTLSVMLQEEGHRVALYDQFYANDPAALTRQYDFITASEVIEHLRDPAAVLYQLWGLLKPGGILAIMTKLAIDAQAFARWHYKRDPTHIVFFSRPTFTWLAQAWQAKLCFVADDVIFLHKTPVSG